MHPRVRAMCQVAVSTVLLSLSAWIAVPTVPPFTLQTAALLIVASLIGRRKSAAAVLLYWLLGVLGLPVFAGFTGGMAVLIGPTGGYLLGFLPMVLLAGTLSDMWWKRLIGWSAGLVSCYLLGTLWYAGMYLTLSPETLLTAAVTCVVPYIVPDLAKGAMAWWICRRVEDHLRPWL